MDLTDKVALITGASSGIGAATAAVFADLGAKVAIGYHNNQKGGEQVRDSIAKAGGQVIGIQADVRNRSGIESLVRGTTGRFGPIDILVNNAGSLVERIKLLEITEEKWDNLM